VIDDDEAIRDLFWAALKSEGYGVDTAENGLEGLRLFGTGIFDLVITDIVMPEKEGLETIQELLRRSPGLKILAVSGGGLGNPFTYLLLAKHFGASGTLVKPISMQDLRAEVGRLLASA